VFVLNYGGPFGVHVVAPKAPTHDLTCVDVGAPAGAKGLGTGTSGFLRLYNDRLGAIHVALRRPEEQRNILTGVARQLSGVNTAISRVEREIELLSEYRTRLVADVVTGKMDVREAAARLPEEPPPDSAENDAELIDEIESANEEAVV
jgi:type I restriction enzyme S subunit